MRQVLMDGHKQHKLEVIYENGFENLDVSELTKQTNLRCSSHRIIRATFKSDATTTE